MHRSVVKPLRLTTQAAATALVIEGTTMDANIRTVPGCHPFLAIAIPPMAQLEVVVVAMVVPQMVGEDSTQEETT